MIGVFAIYKPEKEELMVASLYILIRIADKWFIQDVTAQSGIGWGLKTVSEAASESECDALLRVLHFVPSIFLARKFNTFDECYCEFQRWAHNQSNGKYRT